MVEEKPDRPVVTNEVKEFDDEDCKAVKSTGFPIGFPMRSQR
jgi:hypothetical protein